MASRGTGIVVGSHTVRAVEVRKKGSIVQLSRVASLRVDPSKGDSLAGDGAAVARSLAAEKLHPGPAFLGLTGKDLVIRYTQVPPVPDWKLDTLMRFEIEEVSQQSGGDVSADYAVMNLPAEASSETNVLVAMVKNSLLQPRVKLLESLRLKCLAAVPNSLVLFNAFLWYGDVKAGETTLLVRLGGQNVDVAIQKDGNLLFARNVSGGGSQFTDAIASSFSVPWDRAERMKLQKGNVTPKSHARYADPAEEKIANAIMGVAGQALSAIQSSIMFARAQTRLAELNVQRVVLAGGGANLKGFRQYLETNLGLPVTLFDPLPALDLSPLPQQERELAESDPAGLVTALGLATMALEGGGAFWVEILPESYRKRREFVRGPLFSILAAVLAAVLLIVLFWTTSRDEEALARSEAKNRARVDNVTTRVARFAEDRKKLDASETRYEKVREIAALNRLVARTFGALEKHAIDEVVLDDVKTKWKEREVEREVEPRDRGRRRSSRDRTETVIRREPVLIFKGRITGADPGAKWRRFEGGLQSEPGILVKTPKRMQGKKIEFEVTYPEPKAASDDEEAR